MAVLTGAGCSTASGIPDYRDGNGDWKRQQPMRYEQFVASAASRRRYWARSLLGYRYMRAARPNPAHHALAAMEKAGYIGALITQNVDRLHQQAGSDQVIDLHGRIDRVVCLSCSERSDRQTFQRRLEIDNPEWARRTAAVAPDGDADLEHMDFNDFKLRDCGQCGGILKPDVVFFGESIPRQRAKAASAVVEEADGMLVVGSSLMVFSGFRLVRQASDRQLSIQVINQGRTRADELVDFKLAAPCAEVLNAVAAELAV